MRYPGTVSVAVLAVLLAQVHALKPIQVTEQQGAVSATGGDVRWRTDLAQATLEAKRDKRPLLVVFR